MIYDISSPDIIWVTMKKAEMGKAFGMYERKEMYTRYWLGNVRKETTCKTEGQMGGEY
jgi:hypothetical protein